MPSQPETPPGESVAKKSKVDGSVDQEQSSSASAKNTPSDQKSTVAPRDSSKISASKSNENLMQELQRTPKEIRINSPRQSIDSLSLKPAPILAVSTIGRVSSIDPKGKGPAEVQETRQSVATAYGSNSESSASLKGTALNSRSSSFKEALSRQSNSSENVNDSDEVLNIRISSSNLTGLADRLKQNSATINVFDSKSPEILNVFTANDSSSPNTNGKPMAIRTLADVPLSLYSQDTAQQDTIGESSLKVPQENKRGSILVRSDKGDGRRKSVAFTEPQPSESSSAGVLKSPITPSQISTASPTDSSKSSSSFGRSETSKSEKSFKSDSSDYSKISSSVNTKVDEDEILGTKYDKDDDQVLGKRYSRNPDADHNKNLKKKREKSEIHKRKHQSYLPPGFQYQRPKRPKDDQTKKSRIIETEDGDLASIDKDLIEKRIQKRQSKKLVIAPEPPVKTTVIPPTLVKETNYKTQGVLKGVFLAVSLLYLVILLVNQNINCLNTLLFWHWFGMCSYFTLSFFTTYKNVVQAQQSFYDVDYNVTDTLMLSSATFALLQVAIYWGYYFFIQKDVFIGIGFNLPLLVMFTDLSVSDVQITKITSIFPPIFLICYEFGLWLTRSVLGWDWPMPIYGQYFSMDSNPAMIVAFVIVSCLFVIAGVNIVYFFIIFRNYINNRARKTNPV
ncbi:hypothetical protein HDV01_004222 [Terramyces sp. JEL0728]|nr:hypothetical protein HDV01_004222 [Terramyces sp. JEL0728]